MPLEPGTTLGPYDRRAADGTDEVEQLTSGPTAVATSYTRDGTVLVFSGTDSVTRDDLFVLPMEAGQTPQPLLQTSFDEEHAALSPDGRWIAYTSDESGTEQIYVRPFPSVDDGKWQISTDSAREPVWGPDGREVFYRSADRWTVHGTHQGEFQGIAPTGKQIVLPGTTVHHLADGKIVETWLTFDNLDLLQQLGAVPQPDSA